MSVLLLFIGCLYTGENVTVLASVESDLFVVEDGVDVFLCASMVEECVAAEELQATLVPQDFVWGDEDDTLKAAELEAEVTFWAQSSEGNMLAPAFEGGWDFEIIGGASRAELDSAIEDNEAPVVRLTVVYQP